MMSQRHSGRLATLLFLLFMPEKTGTAAAILRTSSPHDDLFAGFARIDGANYATHGAAPAARFAARGFVLYPEGTPVAFEWRGRATAELAGSEPLPGAVHFLLGQDPAAWRTDCPRFQRLRYLGLAPGVEVDVRAGRGALEYDLVLEPYADLDGVALACPGADAVAVDAEGALLVRSGGALVRQAPPQAWAADPAGGRSPVECRFLVGADGCIRFALDPAARARGAVIDPTLEFASFVGGSSDDRAFAVAAGPAGAVFVAGATASPGLALGAFQGQLAGSYDLFVAKLAAGGGPLQYLTYLGGSAEEFSPLVFDGAMNCALAPRSDGSLLLAGSTLSGDFPVTAGALDPTANGAVDAVVVRLSASGAALLAATYLGGSGDDLAHALAVDQNGRCCVVGETTSFFDFPTTAGAAFPTFQGGFFTGDAFVARLDGPLSSLAYATFLGGSSEERGLAVALDGSGRAVVGGTTLSSDFPVSFGAWDPSGAQQFDLDGFVARLSESGGQLEIATFVGGSFSDEVTALAAAADGTVVVAGNSDSPDFSTTSGAFDPLPDGNSADGFVLRLNPGGQSVQFSTMLGGAGLDLPNALALDAGGRILVAGETRSADLPATPGAPQGALSGTGPDAFFAKLDPGGATVSFLTYLGGAASDRALGLSVDFAARATFAGQTASAGFPVAAPGFDVSYGGGPNDGFVAQVDVCGGAFEAFAIGCPGALAAPPVLAGLGCPSPGYPVQLQVSGAPLGSLGVIILGTGTGVLPVAKACALHIAPIVLPVVVFPTSGGGALLQAELRETIPPGDYYVQSAYLGGALAVSNALRVEVR